MNIQILHNNMSIRPIPFSYPITGSRKCFSVESLFHIHSLFVGNVFFCGKLVSHPFTVCRKCLSVESLFHIHSLFESLLHIHGITVCRKCFSVESLFHIHSLFVGNVFFCGKLVSHPFTV